MAVFISLWTYLFTPKFSYARLHSAVQVRSPYTISTHHLFSTIFSVSRICPNIVMLHICKAFLCYRWDPEIHLNLQMPEFVKVFPDFTNMKKTPAFKNDSNGSRFAYSAPFQVTIHQKLNLDLLRKFSFL